MSTSSKSPPKSLAKVLGFSDSKTRSQDKTLIKQRGRNASLNIIYFVDSERTRSFKLPLKLFYVATISCTFVLGWALLSGYIIAKMHFSNINQEKEIQTLLAAIFDYQSRFDGVFEKAYPPPPSAPKEIKLAAKAGVADKKLEESSDLDLDEFSIVAQDTEEVPLAKAPDEDLNKTAALEAKNDGNLPRLENGNIKVSNTGAVSVSFGIKNVAGTERAQGLLWGVARYKNEDGQEIYISSPESMPLSKNGIVSSTERAQKFNIKYYKARELNFRNPSKDPLEFIDLVVYVKNLEGQVGSLALKPESYE